MQILLHKQTTHAFGPHNSLSATIMHCIQQHFKVSTKIVYTQLQSRTISSLNASEVTAFW